MKKIKAAVCHAFNEPLVIEDIILGEPRFGEIEVTLAAVAICHSDISYAEGAWGGTLPAVYGHEAAGIISQVGPSVRSLNVGDHVIVTLIKSCGVCVQCSQGRPTLCSASHDEHLESLQTDEGQSLHKAMNCGAFAEKVVVDQSQVVVIPIDMPMDSACLMACGVITGIGAVVFSGRLKPGQDVVIIGAGGVGLNAIQAARIAGARRIIAVDLSENKLQTALEFGATNGVLATQGQPYRTTIEILGKGADLVVVTVGSIAAYNQAPHYLERGGRVIMVGMPPSGAASEIEPVILAFSGHGLIGSKMGDVVIQRDIPWIVDLYQQGRLKLDELISKHWAFNQINEAIADTKTGTAKRNVIMFT